MVYDSTDGYTILFGGAKPGFPYDDYNDTWKFSGSQWTNITTSHAPSPRFGFQFADDPADHAVVLFGGRGETGGESYLNDTWEFQAGTWTNVTSKVAPPGRFWGSMSYDTQTGTVLLFGGNEGGAPDQSYSNDTWSFSAGTWTSLAPTKAPPGRDDQNQVDDLADDAVLMFGGLNTSDYVNDTWEYASGTWTAVAPSSTLDARAGPGLAYDSVAGDVVLYGGYPAESYYYSTWLFHAGTWTRYTLDPTPSAGTVWGQMAYDAADNEVLLFQPNGASNATWALTITTGSAPGPLAVQASVSPLSGIAPLPITCSATASGGTPPYTYAWVFSKSSGSSLGNTTYTYSAPGTYQVNLTVTDDDGHTVNQSWRVVAGSAPAPLALQASVSPLSGNVPLTIACSATASGGTPPYAYAWVFGKSSESSAGNTTYTYSAVGTYQVNLTVTDDDGHTASKNWTVVAQNDSSGGTGANSPVSDDVWFSLLGATAVVAIALLFVLRRRRRRPPPPAQGGGPPAPGSPPPAQPPA